jgi:uncharacterized protein
MDVYLPVAEMAVNPWLMVGLGFFVGAMSGVFGVGGGFLMTPMLMLLGIPAPTAVVAGANVAAAASTTSVLGHFERRGVDLRMGLVVSIGGVMGVAVGALLFAAMKSIGADEGLVRMAYVVLLGYVGFTITREAWTSLRQIKSGTVEPVRRVRNDLAHRLPWKVRFPRSRLFISVIPPLAIGFGVGILSAIMGVGGGFLLIPLLIYALHLPPSLVVGTSTFQVLVMASTTTFIQGSANGGLDLILSGMLIAGAVVGAQIGIVIGRRMKGEQIRMMFGLLILLVALRLAADLVLSPEQMFSTSSPGAGL